MNTDDKYWQEYTNLQHRKHELIRHYLGGWFAKIGSWSGRVLYLDTHAGRGRHHGGQLGSPLVALETLLKHSHGQRLLSRCTFVFVFIERDADNADALRKEINALGQLPPSVKVHVENGDCFSQLEMLVDKLNESKSRIAPAFVFVDPYGFKVPGDILRQLMAAGRVELFINVIWRELAMAIAQAPDSPGMSATLDLIFDGPDWRDRISSPYFDERAEQAVNLLAEKIGARWKTHIRMLGDNQATRYLLLHLTNHEAGRDLMKDCMWKVCPDGGFYVRRSSDPSQQLLIKPSPNLKPVEDWLLHAISSSPKRWDELSEMLRSEIWREPHLATVLRDFRKRGVIVAEDYEGKFSRKANPLIRAV